jgi:hypothetical protein
VSGAARGSHARSRRRFGTWPARGLAVLLTAVALGGCAGPLVRLAKQGDWEELDRRARASKQVPRGKAARAWATALIELGEFEEARAVLLRDFRHGGQEPSLLALAELEHELGLWGMAAAHYTRLIDLDLDSVQREPTAAKVCALLRARARAEAAIAEPLAADTDMRRLALVCPTGITEQDRAFLASVQADARAQALGQRSLPDSLTPSPMAVGKREAELIEQLELARKRSPRAMIGLAEAEGIELRPADVALLLAAEFAGALGPGLVASRRLSAWIGDSPVADLIAAIETLPDGAREYALLRLSMVRDNPREADERQLWIVAAMGSLAGQGPHEAAKGWRVAAIAGDLSGAEFALNTNLRDMIPIADPGSSQPPAGPGPSQPPAQVGKPVHWSLRVPVDRRSFDLLLTLARLFELREQPVLALELRRAVIVAGHEVGLAQVGPSAAEEVLRQLALGRPWQALALAEVVPGPLVDELLPVVGSALAVAAAAGLDEAIASDRNVVWRAFGDPWFASWEPRVESANAGLELRAGPRTRAGCPAIGEWLVAERADSLAAVGLDPEASASALRAAMTELATPETGAALVRAIEADLALACSAPLIGLLDAGLHELALTSLAERLTQTPGLSAAVQLQLTAEVAAAIGDGDRATLATISAAAQSVDPRAMWARAATAGLSFGLREYTLEALRQVLLHSEGLDDPAARRELLLIRIRDVDTDEVLREGDPKPIAEIRAAIAEYLDEAPSLRRWARRDALIWALAGEQRADALAWTRLRELLAQVLDGPVAAAHPAAIAAMDRAMGEQAMGEGAHTSVANPGGAAGVLLGDTDAICELAEFGGAALDGPRLLGAATACGPRARAAALASLVAQVEGDAGALRERVLAGTIAAEIDPRQPGVLRAVPMLPRAGLELRVAFDLPLAPVWVTAADE